MQFCKYLLIVCDMPLTEVSALEDYKTEGVDLQEHKSL